MPPCGGGAHERCIPERSCTRWPRARCRGARQVGAGCPFAVPGPGQTRQSRCRPATAAADSGCLPASLLSARAEARILLEGIAGTEAAGSRLLEGELALLGDAELGEVLCQALQVSTSWTCATWAQVVWSCQCLVVRLVVCGWHLPRTELLQPRLHNVPVLDQQLPRSHAML